MMKENIFQKKKKKKFQKIHFTLCENRKKFKKFEKIKIQGN